MTKGEFSLGRNVYNIADGRYLLANGSFAAMRAPIPRNAVAATYVKVLVTERDLLLPKLEGMTPATSALFKHLYPGQLDRASNTDRTSI